MQVSPGFPAVFALGGDGSVWGWGSNNYGLLAAEDTSTPAVPLKLPQLADIAAIASDDFNAYALTRSGTVLAWGDGTSGGLGDVAVERASIEQPRSFPAPPGAVGVAASGWGGLAYGDQVVVWGRYGVPDGTGRTVENPSGGPVPLSWVTGPVGAADAALGLDYGNVFLVR